MANSSALATLGSLCVASMSVTSKPVTEHLCLALASVAIRASTFSSAGAVEGDERSGPNGGGGGGGSGGSGGHGSPGAPPSSPNRPRAGSINETDCDLVGLLVNTLETAAAQYSQTNAVDPGQLAAHVGRVLLRVLAMLPEAAAINKMSIRVSGVG